MTLQEFNDLQLGQIVKYEYDPDEYWAIVQVTNKCNTLSSDIYVDLIVLYMSHESDIWDIGDKVTIYSKHCASLVHL